ncbi:MAG: hypothetical protein ABI678_00595, partial [Kofleriaceae bacterium]
MPDPAELAARTYIEAAHERDPVRRAALLEACFAEDGRVVARSRVFRGRAEISKLIDELYAD